MSTARAIDKPSPTLAQRTTTTAAAKQRPANVHIDIQRIHLHGYTAAQQQRFMQALEQALAAMAVDRQTPLNMASTHLAHVEISGAAREPEDAAQRLVRQLFAKSTASRQEGGHG